MSTTLAAVSPIWTTARAAGIGALLASSFAMTAGLLMALKPAALRTRKLELRAVHEALAIATLVLIVVHGVFLLLDPYLGASAVEILVPFTVPYRPLWVGFGQLAAYGMVALGLTFYVRRRIGTQRWKDAHRWVPVFWAMAILHGVFSGTDAGAWWTWAAIAPPVLVALGLLVQRHAAPRVQPAPS